MSEPVPAWAVACAEAIIDDTVRHGPDQVLDADNIARLIHEHYQPQAREIVEECLSHVGDWQDRAAIRERFAEILREEGKP